MSVPFFKSSILPLGADLAASEGGGEGVLSLQSQGNGGSAYSFAAI